MPIFKYNYPPPDEVRDKLMKGINLKSQAEALGIPSTSFNKRFRACNFKFETPKKLQDDLDLIKRLFTEGKSVEEVASILKVTPAVLVHTYRQQGIYLCKMKKLLEPFTIEIKALLKDNISIKAMSLTLGCKENNILTRLKLLGIHKKRPTKVTLTDEDCKDIIVRHNKGESLKVISKSLGITEKPLMAKLSHKGYTTGFSRNKGSIYLDLYNKGYTTKGIADIFSCSISAVRQVLALHRAKLGIKPPLRYIPKPKYPYPPATLVQYKLDNGISMSAYMRELCIDRGGAAYRFYKNHNITFIRPKKEKVNV